MAILWYLCALTLLSIISIVLTLLNCILCTFSKIWRLISKNEIPRDGV